MVKKQRMIVMDVTGEMQSEEQNEEVGSTENVEPDSPDTSEPEKSAKTFRRTSRVGLISVTLLAILFAASTAFLGYKYWSVSDSEEKNKQSSAAAVEAASAFMQTVLSMDTADLENYKNNLNRMTTGALKERLLSSFDTASGAAAAAEVKAEGRVVAIAPEENGETDMKVVVIAEQSGTNAATGGRSVDSRLAVRVFLELVDGQWLAKDVQSL